MSREPAPPKDETFFKILSTALMLDFKLGHLRWTITQLSRASSITRSLIYYYFGKSRQDILLEAVRLVGDDLAGFSPTMLDAWQRGDLYTAVQHSRTLLAQVPAIIPFYYTHRNDDTDIGKEIRHFEQAHLQRLLPRFFPTLTQPFVEAVFALLLGLSYAPLMSDEAVKIGVDVTLKGLADCNRVSETTGRSGESAP